MIRIGVTGHRVLADVEKIDAAIELALHSIESKFPGETLRVVSSLAEGADRIVVTHALKRAGTTLVVPLPMHKADYILDFHSEDSRAEFNELIDRAAQVVEMPIASSRPAAYEAAGDSVLNNSDILITIWDGQKPQGRGGTAAIVTRARKRKLPIVWIHAGNRAPGTRVPVSLGDAQGLVTFENF